MNWELLFDGFLALWILTLAILALSVQDIFRSILFFIAFGLGMALAWARLAAPDVALAEAAIGAGLLGVLLISASRAFAPSTPKSAPGRFNWTQFLTPLPVILLSSTVAMWLLIQLRTVPAHPGLVEPAAGALPESGVEHPVTAVLLNYRAYDTWLEIGVLLLAVWIIRAIAHPGTTPSAKDPNDLDSLRLAFVRGILPLLLLIAGYLLWAGKFAPGGAFQSGVMLGAGGILAALAGLPVRRLMQPPARDWLPLAGFGAFLLAAFLTLLMGRPMLAYPVDQAGSWILLLEALGMLSIGFLLFAFFVLAEADGKPSAAGEPVAPNEGGRP